MEEKNQNIVMFPFMAQGHTIPFLTLALKIEKMGYKITFVNTPLNIKNLKKSLPPSSTIRLVEIPFDSSKHGLPPGLENTDTVTTYDLMLDLFEASLSLKPYFRNLLSDLISGGASLLCVITDMFFAWTADVTHEFGVFHAIFSGCSGFGLGCYYSLWMNLPHRKTESLEFSLPDFHEAGKIHVTQLMDIMLKADGTDRWSRFLIYNLSLWVRSDAILLNTVEEIDGIGLSYFRIKLGLPVWPIGPVLRSVDNRSRGGKVPGISPELCIKWLDSKPLNSVLYISFGSQSTISASQMMQLAKALEMSGNNFIWVVRPPLGFDINAEFEAEEWLPEGFAKRAEEQNRGLIVTKWAPQVEILSHKSVAAFLSHCGWNSVLESLSCGVPLIGWPFYAEQFYNAKLLVEEVGVCVEVARGTHFEVRREDIVHKIEMVMRVDGKAKQMREKACEVETMIGDAIRDEEDYKGSSVKSMEEFLNAALLTKESKT
ncbi:Glycosyltransferase [Heracleum sosnowskyi]|uniref:Glycosyltransferase n=1 Tax=Heracleum sosnowskyi TaxID=360622 RepID=A0AAD8HGN3_9APIA|nr:Glycosyltransferase [Heracleum sosnowskyi]